MTRPLMNQSIDELEALFRTGPKDGGVLEKLRRELVNRKTPRALALLQRVEKNLKSLGQNALPQHQLDLPTPPPPGRTPELRVAPIIEPVIVPLIKPVEHDEPKGSYQGEPRSSQAEFKPRSEMDGAKALSVLGLSSNASWEVVEAARRKLVARANPTETRRLDPAAKERALAEARRVNSAYLALAASRTLAVKLR